ncbi:hypothetical protein WR25_00927 [Diploscapter pachys]|uniref:Uncharacterized protein n=1 Tax=Diploscapter pachys TaxID=2018661 RepID=A0A2A2KVM7_9BILA|nr:hypothetical protein WR25_00927 [Diploscapter pachys]
MEEINEHRAERHKMQIELDEVGQRLEQMHKEAELYKKNGEEKDETIRELRKKLESSSAENAKTTAESAQERDFYKTQFETSRDRVRELQQLLELEKSQTESQRSQIAELRTAHEDELRHLRTEHNNLQARYESEMNGWTREVELYEKDLENAEHDKYLLQTKLDKLELHMQRLRDELEEVYGKKREQTLQMETLQEKIDLWKDRHQKLMEQNQETLHKSEARFDEKLREIRRGLQEVNAKRQSAEEDKDMATVLLSPASSRQLAPKRSKELDYSLEEKQAQMKSPEKKANGNAEDDKVKRGDENGQNKENDRLEAKKRVTFKE